jgi:hypothetical protein
MGTFTVRTFTPAPVIVVLRPTFRTKVATCTLSAAILIACGTGGPGTSASTIDAHSLRPRSQSDRKPGLQPSGVSKRAGKKDRLFASQVAG